MASIETLLTAEEYLTLPDNGCPTELVRGKVVPLNAPNFRHGKLCLRIGRLLGNYVEDRNLGHVLSNDSGLITERGPDTVRGPDVSFYSYSRIPEGADPAGYAAVAPEVAIEVRSPTDRWPKVLAKVSEYLNAGVDAVYVVDAQSQSVFVYSADQPGITMGLDADITFPPPLDGLCIPVRDLFKSKR
jgi:Uma2 family endonuclease